jgi:hypothetical protein
MQSTPKPKEAPMLKKHLTRLTLTVVTASITVAILADGALAGIRW